MIPSGPEPKTSFTKGFFDTAMAQNPKPTTVAIVAADAEFSKNASDPETLAIVTPAEYKSGDVIYPFEKARQ